MVRKARTERRRGSVAYTLCARVGDQPLEPAGRRVGGEQAAGEREVGRGRAVAAAEPEQRVGAEPLGPGAGAAHERGKLLPARGPLAREAINIHRREGV